MKDLWRWDFFYEVAPALLKASLITVEATLIGMLLALSLGLVWAIGKRSEKRWIAWPVKVFIEFVRSTPLLVQLYFFFYVLPGVGIKFSPLATGFLALGLHYSSYTAEVYRSGIEAVPRGQWEAARALNLSVLQTWRSIILPQAIPPIVPALGNYFLAMFKDTPILSAITVLEILQTAKILGSETFRYLEPFTFVGVYFLVVSLLAAWGLRILERQFSLQRVRA